MQLWIEKLLEFKKQKIPVALVTITKIKGSSPCKVGARMLVTLDKTIHGTVGGGKLEFQIINKAAEAIQSNTILEFSYTLGPEFEQCCGGIVELIIEPMNLEPNLYLFGAGHIGQEICNILKDTPYKIHLMDTRKGWENEINIGEHVNYSSIDFDLYKSHIQWGSNCYMVIMTHDHKLDYEITALALDEQTKYIGLIGSKTKKVKFHNMLKNELGFENGIEPVNCPVGLDIGGITPNEIAISVAAELLKVHYGK
ncbi:MAG: xanthine dehydrogenase accessory protein XdhC [Bacteroidetes bacterium MedPE-SWsnd-G1]|nr:MAG: xanthine dehydrogenase accessory protein XdhC [Bacteroidetes bacterium MedPE-SWsnd-G1]